MLPYYLRMYNAPLGGPLVIFLTKLYISSNEIKGIPVFFMGIPFFLTVVFQYFVKSCDQLKTLS